MAGMFDDLPTAKPAGMFDDLPDAPPKREVGALESAGRSVQGRLHSITKNILGMPLAGAGVIGDLIHGAFSGRTETGLQDAAFEHIVAPEDAHIERLAIHPETEQQSFGAKLAGDAAGVVPDLGLMLATGGAGEAVPATQMAKPALQSIGETIVAALKHSAGASALPGVVAGSERAQQHGDTTVPEALADIATGYEQTAIQNTLPMAAPVRAGASGIEAILTRALTGAVSMPAVSGTMAAIEGQPFTAEDAARQAVIGSVLAQAGASRAQPHGGDLRGTAERTLAHADAARREYDAASPAIDPDILARGNAALDPNPPPEQPAVSPRQGGPAPGVGPTPAEIAARLRQRAQEAAATTRAPEPAPAAPKLPEGAVEHPAAPETDAEALQRELAAAQAAFETGKDAGAVDFQSDPSAPKEALDRALAMPDADYIAAINPEREATSPDAVQGMTDELHQREVSENATPVDQHDGITYLADGNYLYAMDGDRMVGILGAARSGNEFVVDPEYRGRGIGKRMMRELLVRDPMHLSGGLSPAAERTRLAALRDMRAEQGTTEAPTAGDRAAPEPVAAVADQPTTEAPRATEPEPPAPPAEVAPAAEPERPSGNTSTKNAVTDAERAAEGRPEREQPETQHHDDVVAQAKVEYDANPHRGNEVVEKLRNAGTQGISVQDEATLLIHKQTIRTRRDAAADRATDPSLSEDQRAAARKEYDALEAHVNEIDEASGRGGTEWGRLGALRRREIRRDFSLEAMERKARVARDRPLTAEESAEVKVAHAKIEALETQLEAASKKLAEQESDANSKVVYADLVKTMARELAAAHKNGGLIETLEKRADAARARLRAKRGQFNAGVDPRDFLDLVEIGAYHVAKGARDLSDWLARMKADLGHAIFGDVESALPDVFEAAKKAQAKGGKKPETPAEVTAGIKDGKIEKRHVYALARAHVLAGVKGENAVMAAVHADLVKIAPDITERDVRRLFSDYGKVILPSKAADRVALREIRSLVQMQESIDRLEEGLAALKSGPQRDAATQAIREKRAKLNDMLKQAERQQGISEERLASYQQARATNLKHQIEDLEKQLRTGEKPAERAKAPEPNAEVKRLIEVRDGLKEQLAAIEAEKNPPKSPEERYQAVRSKGLQRQLAEVKRRLAAGDYERATRPPPKALNAENARLAFALSKAKADFATKQFEAEMARRTKWKKALGAGAETLNLARAMMTSLDLSAVGRQGAFIVFGHPVRAAKAFAPMLRAAFSERAEHRINDELAHRPNAPLYKRFKLELTDAHHHSLTKMEEAFMSRWIDRSEVKASDGAIKAGLKHTKNVVLAPVRGSNRAYTTFLNVLRADSFDAMAATLCKGKEPTKAEGEAIAKFINVATGRGNIGENNRAAVGLNTVFFAPRLVASRFQLLAGSPMWGGTAKTRALIAGEYARFLTGAVVVYTLAGMALNDDDGKKDSKGRKTDKDGDAVPVSLDPRSVDFLRIRMGHNTYIDPLAGLQQVSVLLTREASGEAMSANGNLSPLRTDYRWSDAFPEGSQDYKKSTFGQVDGYGLLTRFARTKLAPVPGTVVDLLTGTDVVGNEVTPDGAALKLVTPMTLQDIGKIMEDNGVERGTAATMLNLFGLGIQYRAPKEKKPKHHD